MKSKNELEIEDERKDIEKTGRLLVTGDLHGDTAALVMIAKKMLEGDVLFVDDVIPFLREAERKGIRSYHISSFLDWDLQW